MEYGEIKDVNNTAARLPRCNYNSEFVFLIFKDLTGWNYV